MPVSLSERIRSFVLEKVDSVGHLEVLDLMAADPTRTWTADEVSHELRTNSSLASDQLQALVNHQLLIRLEDSRFQFSPMDPKDLTRVTEVLNTFRDRRRVIISLIYSKPAERVKNLADAFKIRKEDF